MVGFVRYLCLAPPSLAGSLIGILDRMCAVVLVVVLTIYCHSRLVSLAATRFGLLYKVRGLK